MALAALGGGRKNRLVVYYGYRCIEALPYLPQVELPVVLIKGKTLFIGTAQASSAKQRTT